jgi:hypothetical protein
MKRPGRYVLPSCGAGTSPARCRGFPAGLRLAGSDHTWMGPVLSERTGMGLDVHARRRCSSAVWRGHAS